MAFEINLRKREQREPSLLSKPLLPYLNQHLDSSLFITGILDENRLIKERRGEKRNTVVFRS